jgi:NAD+ diphosphatase
VRREVAEESGVAVGEVRYAGSQPWPFPSSLMLGFYAEALPGPATADGEEIAELRWFTREELAASVADRSVLLSPRVSIARRLIEGWYGAEIATGRDAPLR